MAERKARNYKFKEGTAQTTIVLAKGDREFLEQIQETLGVTMSEAIRTAIRVYAALLQQQK